jgi:hypothetical protein
MQTEQINSGGSNSVLCSGGSRLESRQKHHLTWICRGFILSLREMSGHYLEVSHNIFLPPPFKLIFYLSPYPLRYAVWATENIVKW